MVTGLRFALKFQAYETCVINYFTNPLNLVWKRGLEPPATCSQNMQSTIDILPDMVRWWGIEPQRLAPIALQAIYRSHRQTSSHCPPCSDVRRSNVLLASVLLGKHTELMPLCTYEYQHNICVASVECLGISHYWFTIANQIIRTTVTQ